MNWSTLEKFKKLSDKIEVKVIKGNINKPITGNKWKVEVEGEFKDMSLSNKGFNQKQLEQIAQVVVATVQPMIQPIVQRLDNIETRLENVEQDIRDIKDTPTIKRELKSHKNKIR